MKVPPAAVSAASRLSRAWTDLRPRLGDTPRVAARRPAATALLRDPVRVALGRVVATREAWSTLTSVRGRS
jgi:hypothetical protein